jgi:hypothetical protein
MNGTPYFHKPVSQMLVHSRGEAWRRLILPEHNEEDADMKVVLLMMVALTGFLAGCTTPAELAAQDHETCTGYGFNPQTMPADYAACRMQVAQDRENRDNMTRAALFVGSAARPAPRY